MTINIKHLTPALAIHPGEMLKDELDARSMKQKDFALLTGIPQTQLNEIIKGKRDFNADIALIIGTALKMDASLWLALQANYELGLAKIKDRNKARMEAIDQWQMIKSYVPEKFFKKEKIIFGNPLVDIPIIKNIYNAQNFEQLAAVYSQAPYARFRKSEKLSIDKVNVVGWVKLVVFKAGQIKAAPFDSSNQAVLLEELSLLFKKNKKTVEKTAEILLKYGIKLVVQGHPEKCAVDGISFWSNGNPAIGLSLRHNRIDNFAFTILHELGHIFLHLVNNNTAEFIDMDEQHDTIEYKNSKEEKEANEFASDSLINKAAWELFTRNNKRFNEENILVFSNKEKINPAIVLGRFSHETKFFAIKTSINRQLN